MKKFKYVPLVAMISAGILGCGGGSSGGGGTPPTPPKPKMYSLQLVHMLVNQDPSNISSACQSPTYFKEYSDGNVDYAQIVSSVHSVGSYNQDGSFNKALSLSSNGVVAFTENDVEDGGYITIIDNVGSASSPIFHTLSIQKPLLGNYLINVESQQGNQSSCYQGGKLAFDNTQRVMNLSSGSDLGSPTESGFETYRDGEDLTPYSQTEKRPINLVSSSEYVLGKAYSNGEIKGYVLSRGSELSVDGDSSINSQRLVALTESAQVSWPNSSPTLTSVELQALAQNERYKWQTLTNGISSVLVSDTFSYSLYLKGAMNGWGISSVQPQQSRTIDIALTESTVVNGIEPSLVCTGSRCVVDNDGVVDTSLNRLQRAYFEVGSSKHTIYGEPNAQDELVIPDYQIGSAHKPQGSEALEVSYINYPESLGSDFFALVMNKYNDPESSAAYVDKVSIVKTPQEMRTLEVQEANFDFEIIQK